MKKLTNKEKEIMDLYWQYGPMFVRELLEHYDEPRPHFNTLSTLVRILEAEYGRSSIAGVIKNYFDDSYKKVVSSFVKEEKISIAELKELIKEIENA